MATVHRSSHAQIFHAYGHGVAAAALAFTPAPALAGDATMARSDGTRLEIKGRGSGCTVRGKNPGGKWGVVEKGPGGSKNFKKLKAKYEGMGFSD